LPYVRHTTKILVPSRVFGGRPAWRWQSDFADIDPYPLLPRQRKRANFSTKVAITQFA